MNSIPAYDPRTQRLYEYVIVELTEAQWCDHCKVAVCAGRTIRVGREE